MLILSLDNIPTDFCALINTLSDFALIIILSEFSIFCGLLNDDGMVGVNDLKSLPVDNL